MLLADDKQSDVMREPASDFWLSCGHHLLDREESGGLVVTDEFIKAYLARPELSPPPEACVVERTIHAAFLMNPRRPFQPSEIAAIADPDARENWAFMVALRDLLMATRPSKAHICISCATASAPCRRCFSTSSFM